MNKVVARYADGRLVKGLTHDFNPTRPVFHVVPTGVPDDMPSVVIRTAELKALFFVKDFDGNPDHVDKGDFNLDLPLEVRRISASFKDGEVIVGSSNGFRAGRPGFFLVPADPESNNERCYVVTEATSEVRYI